MRIHTNLNERLLRLPDVKQRTGLGRSSIYAFEKEGNFPKRIPIGSKSVGWLESEIDAWIAAKIEASRKGK